MSIYSLFGGPSPEEITQQLLAEIEKLGAVRMEAAYDGGNDEGGVRQINLFGADDALIEAPAHTLPDMKEYTPHPLWDAADALLSTEYGTWAGDFHAFGTLHANVTDRKAWTDGSYEVSAYESGHDIGVEL